jgi:5-methylcytosine-specific restriction protein A
MLARAGPIPSGRGWTFEPKLDGFRCLVSTHATFLARSRRGWDMTPLPSGWTWGELRTRVHERDHACVRCGSTRRLQVHHRTPLARGGTNELDNLQLLCHTLEPSKRDA